MASVRPVWNALFRRLGAAPVPTPRPGPPLLVLPTTIRRQLTNSALLRGKHDEHDGGLPFGNMPFSNRNRYIFTLIYTVFFASGFGIPYLLLRFQLLKGSGKLGGDLLSGEDDDEDGPLGPIIRTLREWMGPSQKEKCPIHKGPCTCDN